MFNISIKKIEEEIRKLNKEDIINYSKKYNVYLNKKELDFIYSFIKNNHREFLNNPQSFNLANYKSNFSEENYVKLNNLYNKYSSYLKLIQLS